MKQKRGSKMKCGEGKPSIKKNLVMNTILTMSSFLFPLITFPYVSRILLPVGTGKVSFATSLISYFNMLAQLGVPTYGIRACAKARDDREKLTRTAHELLIINLAMSCFSYLLLIIGLLFIPRLREDRSLYLIVSLTIILNAIGMEWLYKALEQYSYITIRSMIFKVISLTVMFLMVHHQEDYVIYGGITILASSASNIMNLFNVRRYIAIRPIGKYHPMRHMKAVAVFFAMACSTTIYTNLDTVMLGFMKTDTDVGYYNAAVRIKTILVSIVTSLGTVLLPRMSYYIEHEQFRKFYKVSRKSLNFVILLAAPLVLYFIAFARHGIYFLSGTAYEGAVIPMQIIMPTVLLIGVTNILGIQILVPLGKEKTVLKSEIAGAVIDLILNLILIPHMSSSGAAIGTLIAETVVLIVQYVGLRREGKKLFQTIQYGKIVSALFLAVLASLWVIPLQLGNFITLFCSSILFFCTYGCVLVITKEPLVLEICRQIFAIFNKKKK